MHVKIIQYIKNKINSFFYKANNLKIFFLQIILKKQIAPTKIYIEPTNICNANCIFCAYQFYKADKKIINLNLFEKILIQAKQLNVNDINLTPFAGEILLDKTIIKKINLIKKYNFKSCSTYTNLINLHKFDTKELLNSGLTNLNISVSPLDKILYQKIYRSSKYEFVLQNLINLLQIFNSLKDKTVKQIRIEFRSNMSLRECTKLPDYQKIKPMVDDNKNIIITAMHTFDSWMGMIQKKDLLDGMMIANSNFKKRFPCTRLNNVQVLSNGDMRICGCRFNNNSDNDIFLIGNINNKTISEAYNSKIVHDIKKSFIRGKLPIECQKCSWYNQ